MRLQLGATSMVEISADFRLAETTGHVFVGLSALTDNREAGRVPLYLFFSGRPESGRYSAHTRYIEPPATVEPERPYARSFGDEASRYHTLKILYDRDRSEIVYHADRKIFGRARLKGELGAVNQVRLMATSSVAGSRLDVRLDNLRVRIWGDRFLEKLIALKRVDWKRRDPVEPRLVWYFDKEGLALADIREKKTIRFQNVMDIPNLRITGMVFGPRSVWFGTPQGLLAWDRERRFWYRVAVGAYMVDANVQRLWQDEGKLYVLARRENGAATYELDLGTSKWRRWRSIR